MKRELLLRLVMAAKAADQLGHPRALIAPFLDEDTVVHALQPTAVAFEDLAGSGDLVDGLGIAARESQADPAGPAWREMLELRFRSGHAS